MNKENLHGKNPYWVILRSPLPRIHYYHNKWLQVKESQLQAVNMQLYVAVQTNHQLIKVHSGK